MAGYTEVIKSITDPIEEYLPELPDELFFFLEERGKNGIYMVHGIADKNYHKVERLKQIKYLLYPGPAWKEKFVKAGVPEEKIFVVGWPRLDPVFQGKIGSKKVGGKRVVAWCPTHDAIPEISSYPNFSWYLGELQNELGDEFEVVSSVHPARRGDRKTSLELLVEADVILSDSSSILYEVLVVGKPVVLLDFLVKEGVFKVLRGTFEEYIYREGIGYHASSFDELPEVIRRAVEEGVDERTEEFIERFYPTEFRGHSGEVTAGVLKHLMRGFS